MAFPGRSGAFGAARAPWSRIHAYGDTDEEPTLQDGARPHRTLRVAYPAGRGRIVLRTEPDWDWNLEPVQVSEDGTTSTFALEADQPFLYFKPCLVESGTHPLGHRSKQPG